MRIGKKYFEKDVELEAKVVNPEIMEDGQDKTVADDTQTGDERESIGDGVQGKEETDAEPPLNEESAAEKPQKRGRKAKVSE